MINRRTLGIFFGAVSLLAVVSGIVLLPAGATQHQAPQIRPVMSSADMTRLDNLHQTALAQHDEIVLLSSETRRLSELLAAQQVVEVTNPPQQPHRERIAQHRGPNPGRVAAP